MIIDPQLNNEQPPRNKLFLRTNFKDSYGGFHDFTCIELCEFNFEDIKDGGNENLKACLQTEIDECKKGISYLNSEEFDGDLLPFMESWPQHEYLLGTPEPYELILEAYDCQASLYTQKFTI